MMERFKARLRERRDQVKQRLRERGEQLRALSDKYLTVKLLHAWVLGFVAMGYVGYAAPLALQSLVLVAAKVWVGALMGFFLGKAMFDEGEVGYRRTAVVCAAILAMSLGV